ncbi:MAG: tryptophan 2,3-dioxygenase family protein [Myxococcota bacterium]|nr:tryptophan 2,3-dioxygenase family protein [Myxococcota bacterium]
MTTSQTPNYWSYLKLHSLLGLQNGLEADEADVTSDELHFIIVHQTLELWFKLVIRELRLARDHLASPELPEEHVPYVVHHLRRVIRILGLAVEHFHVMESLTPQDFLAFRDKLTPASGFQSFQMRTVEVLLGLDHETRPTYGKTHPIEHLEQLTSGCPMGHSAWSNVSQALDETTLRQALHDWLYRTPIFGSSPEDDDDSQVVERFLEAYLSQVERLHRDQAKRIGATPGIDVREIEERFAQTNEAARQFLWASDVDEADRPRIQRIRAALLFIESYRELPLLAWPRLLLDAVVEVEEQMVLWRHRHARMVERIIGRRVGTGGSSGVDYLDKTTRVRVFTELWAIRSFLLPKTELPPLENAEFYGFAT